MIPEWMSHPLRTVGHMVRFIHTADWQLGMTRHFLQGEAQARFTQARIEAIDEIGRLALANACSFVVVGGDVFESNHVERRVVLRALDAMGSTPDVTYYLLPGNHDPLDASSVFTSSAFLSHRPDNVIVLASTEPVEVAPGVELVGAPWPNKRPGCDLVSAAIRSADTGCGETGSGETGSGFPASADTVSGVESSGNPHHGGAATLRIVVGHGAIDYLCPEHDAPEVLRLADLEEAVTAGSVHYVALGDRHSVTSVGSTGRIWYSGAPEPTDFDEVEPARALVVELTSDSVDVEAHRIGRWTFARSTIELSAAEDISALGEYLESFPDKQRTILKLALVGQLSLGDNAALEELLALAGERFAAIQLWDLESDLVVVPDEEDFETLGLSGFAEDALNDLRSLGAGEAMRLLYRLNSSSDLETNGVRS